MLHLPSGPVGESIYHVRKVSIGLKRKYRISADDGSGRPGEPLGYAEKELKAADEIVIYRDQDRTERLATVRESSAGFLASLTGYEVFDPEDRRLGSFGVRMKESVERTTWELDQPGLGRFTGTERSVKTARLRRLVSVGGGTLGEIANALTKYHFDFERDGSRMLSIEKPKVFDDWYRLTVHADALDPVLLFALTITMESRQR
jgi:hypothetical protein